MEMEKEVENNEILADLHVHSRFSRACSKSIDIPNLVKYAKIKGINLLGTADFQHPEWFKELDALEEKEGLLYHEGFPFLWQSEISLMYTQDGKGRRIHHVLFAPSKEVVKQIIAFFLSKGRIDYDGRPIFGFSSVEFVDEMIKISEDIEIIPAHCMTPWFGIFGSQTGFDSLKQCFQEKTDKIHAVESGLSADPEMLRRFSFLDNKAVISSSDMHSFWPWRIGREATIFTLSEGNKLSYKNILKQIRENSFKATMEVDPAYGKYHFDGHRNCNFSCSPEESKKLNNLCPKCGKPLIIGVENRVEQLATLPRGHKPPYAKPFYKLLPLHELIALANGSSLNTKKTWLTYNQLLEKFENEFDILLRRDKQELAKALPKDEQLVNLIINNRIGNIKVKPGYDGEYGVVVLNEKQGKLF